MYCWWSISVYALSHFWLTIFFTFFLTTASQEFASLSDPDVTLQVAASGSESLNGSGLDGRYGHYDDEEDFLDEREEELVGHKSQGERHHRTPTRSYRSGLSEGYSPGKGSRKPPMEVETVYAELVAISTKLQVSCCCHSFSLVVGFFLYKLGAVFLPPFVCSMHLNPKRPGGGGGGGQNPPFSTFRAIVSGIFYFRAASFHDFFLWGLAQLWAQFSEKSGVRFLSYATLCNRTSAQNLTIFWICVQNVWKMASCAKTPFWALKCSICFHYS